jgi:hypothetical protein
MISANSLFHFTRTLDDIQNILTNDFIPHYCLENFNHINDTSEFAIPMTCFCDIPLSQITGHIDNYGHYAIGLKKEWAFNKGISPLIYLHTNSHTNIYLKRLIESTALNPNMDFKDLNTIYFLEFICYSKIYKGKLLRGIELSKEITFYNEREWRYVPTMKDLKLCIPDLFISKEDYFDEKLRDNFNNTLQHLKLTFTPKDINYIVIDREDERLQIVNLIEQIKGNKFTLNDIKRLNSKIISVEQITNDF